MFAALRRAFRPLDTSQADAAIAEAERGHREVQVRARAVRMDVSCGKPGEAVRKLTEALDHRGFFDRAWPVLETPRYLRDLTDRI